MSEPAPNNNTVYVVTMLLDDQEARTLEATTSVYASLDDANERRRILLRKFLYARVDEENHRPACWRDWKRNVERDQWRLRDESIESIERALAPYNEDDTIAINVEECEVHAPTQATN